MDETPEVSLVIRAIYDQNEEAVGIDVDTSEAFAAGKDTRAMVELLAAIVARANALAAEVISGWDATDERKKDLVDHFAALKESMLNDMLDGMDGETSEN